MKPLYTEEKFRKAKSNDKLELECELCSKIIIKEKRVIKYGIKGYDGRQNDLCIDCFYENKTKYLELTCDECDIIFKTKAKDKKASVRNFCSKKCSIENLNTQNNIEDRRKTINKKISESLKGKKYVIKDKSIKEDRTKNYVSLICQGCKTNFCSINRKKMKYCSPECVKKYLYESVEYRTKMSIRLKGKSGGLRNGGGYSKVYEYINTYGEKMYLNKSEIKIAKVLDNLKVVWNRNNKGFDYIDLVGNNRKYYPDFYLKEYDYYLEYKGFVTEKMKHKMDDAVSKNKINLLIIYSNDKRYRDKGLNEDMLIRNESIIFNYIKGSPYVA